MTATAEGLSLNGRPARANDLLRAGDLLVARLPEDAGRGVEPEDLCFLTEQEQIWAGMLADVLQKEGIPCLRKSVLGAGLALKGGVMMERERFYVYFRQLPAAREVVEGLGI